MYKIIYNKNITNKALKELNVYIDKNCDIGNNVTICQGVSILNNSKIESNCELGVNSIISNSLICENVKIISSYIEDCCVGKNSTVGPFATLKKGSAVGANCRIGNFVEIKNSNIGNDVKIAHLTYVGDADIKDNCNIGCGVVFCNYDGEKKRRSEIEENVFIGSNVNIIAPVKIGAGAYIAAGSTICKDVESNQFSIARSYQTNKEKFNNPYLNKLKNK